MLRCCLPCVPARLDGYAPAASSKVCEAAHRLRRGFRRSASAGAAVVDSHRSEGGRLGREGMPLLRGNHQGQGHQVSVLPKRSDGRGRSPQTDRAFLGHESVSAKETAPKKKPASQPRKTQSLPASVPIESNVNHFSAGRIAPWSMRFQAEARGVVTNMSVYECDVDLSLTYRDKRGVELYAAAHTESGVGPASVRKWTFKLDNLSEVWPLKAKTVSVRCLARPVRESAKGSNSWRRGWLRCRSRTSHFSPGGASAT